MKKTVLILSTVLILLLVVWTGLTFAYSKMVEPLIDASVTMINEEIDKKGGSATFEKTSFENGFLSSQVTTSVEGNSIMNAIKETDRIDLNHQVYHGPIAVTPDGIRFCQAYVVSTLNRLEWKDADVQTVEKAFAGAEPITIKSWRNITGGEGADIVIAPFSMQTEEFTVDFQGAHFTVEGDSADRTGTATVKISAFTAEDGNRGGKVTLSPSSGSCEFDADSHLVGKFELGALEIQYSDAENGVTKVATGGAEVDFDLKRTNPDISLMLGESVITLPNLSYRHEELSFDISHFTVKSLTTESDGIASATVEYVLGSLAGGNLEEMLGGPNLSDLFPANLTLQFDGVDGEAADRYISRMRQLHSLPASDAKRDRTGTPSEEAVAAVDAMFDMVKPGTGFMVDLDLGKNPQGENLGLDFEVNFAGSKSLRQLSTGKDVLDSLDASLALAANKNMKEHQLLGPIIMEWGLMGILTPNENGNLGGSVQFQNSALSIGGAPFPIPLLQMIQPALEEPIQWELLSKGMAMGMEAGAAR